MSAADRALDALWRQSSRAAQAAKHGTAGAMLGAGPVAAAGGSTDESADLLPWFLAGDPVRGAIPADPETPAWRV